MIIGMLLPDIAGEEQLLARARRGHADALRQIYEAYFPAVYQFIRLRVADRATAEDIAGNVFVKLVRACKAGNVPHTSLRGWLFRVARSELHDHYGAQTRLRQTTLEEWLPAPNDQEPEAVFLRSLSLEQARWALRQLSDEQQEVLVLRFGQLLSLQETADIMGKKPNAIKALQFRAVNALRRLIGEKANP